MMISIVCFNKGREVVVDEYREYLNERLLDVKIVKHNLEQSLAMNDLLEYADKKDIDRLFNNIKKEIMDIRKNIKNN